MFRTEPIQYMFIYGVNLLKALKDSRNTHQIQVKTPCIEVQYFVYDCIQIELHTIQFNKWHCSGSIENYIASHNTRRLMFCTYKLFQNSSVQKAGRWHGVSINTKTGCAVLSCLLFVIFSKQERLEPNLIDCFAMLYCAIYSAKDVRSLY